MHNNSNSTNVGGGILILAGGTGGHVIPALTVANELRAKQIPVNWLGTTSGIEFRLVRDAGIPLHIIPIKPIRGKGFLRILTSPFHILKSIYSSLKMMRKIKPKVVLSMGGYVAGPGGIAAWLLKIPLLIHEQNSIPGMTNKILARFARKIMIAFPSARLSFRLSKKKLNPQFIIETGNPVRSNLFNANPNSSSSSQPLKILVLGGSGGATAINQMVPKAVSLIPIDKRPQILHQSGMMHLESTQNAYYENKVEAEIKPYIDDMKKAYEFADVVICRSGALTVSELAAVGRASILIPFPHAVDDHQTENARYLTANGAGIQVAQSDLSPEKLQELIQYFIDNPNECEHMAEKARKLGKIDATKQVMAECLNLMNG